MTEATTVPVPEVMVHIDQLDLRYGQRMALDKLTLQVPRGGLFGLLGPNGSGKTTLLRVLATLLQAGSGGVKVAGLDVATQAQEVRRHLGVVFQNPGLDGKLNVSENLRFQGYLYGIHGKALKLRCDELLEHFGLTERRRDTVETLSGGLKRRVELAKALLHHPRLLLMDEPSSGLDLAARRAFWQVLEGLVAQQGLTVIVATHLMDEAERCARVAMLQEGRLVADGAPAELRASLGGDVLTVAAQDADALAETLRKQWSLEPRPVGDGTLRVTGTGLAALVPKLWEALGSVLDSVSLGRPTLADVFLARTGHAIGGAPAGSVLGDEGDGDGGQSRGDTAGRDNASRADGAGEAA